MGFSEKAHSFTDLPREDLLPEQGHIDTLDHCRMVPFKRVKVEHREEEQSPPLDQWKEGQNVQRETTHTDDRR